MDEAGRNQLVQFITEYPTHIEAASDTDASNDVDRNNIEPETPGYVRRFCVSFKAQREQVDTDSVIGRIRHLAQVLEAYDAYLDVHKNLKGDSSTSKFSKTSKGFDHISVATETLVVASEVKESELTSTRDRGGPFHLFVKKLGLGFLPLLSLSCITFMKEIGIGRLAPACDLLLESCPYIPEFAGRLETYILQLFHQGVKELPVDVDYLEPAEVKLDFLTS